MADRTVNQDLPGSDDDTAANTGGAQTVLPGEDAADTSAAGAAPGGTAIDRGLADAMTEGDSGGDSVSGDADLPGETDGSVASDPASAG
ncbi:hypothetical protein C5C18_13970 [Rathayibacter tritici]|uniref:Uncharacterized protein n=1 Tax=Rathayibacter tritici TaxID=33888 RepID=A0A160KR62_9MICO|nr:hypothetical protein [Rathayibacter tritici]AND16086.1 hypothetical protein A6122_0933 [Rathayibacter tritici]PPF22225.1 hypothetical protein C5C06_14870 [Rathayibacter tritici]PPF63254.1 hypothetical protein C5C21_13375 [Rathayibacter tritici]PPG04119.1 hypothetical protein C5C18_13970 [Rathayibacter tritici]PPI12336.1 hypothetical protein C5D07_13080 [Rathayibacter tritici]